MSTLSLPLVGRIRAGHRRRRNKESLSARLNWLRAGVLGANDGIVSISGLLIGVAAVDPSRTTVIALAGVAGIVSAAISMAVGEYISVSTQRDTQRELVDRTRAAVARDPAGQQAELADLWARRGLSADTAEKVAGELSRDDAVGAQLSARYGLDARDLNSPWAAAGSSFVSFLAGSLLPTAAMLLTPPAWRIGATILAVLAALTTTGLISSWLGETPRKRSVARLLIGGTAAMAITYLIGNGSA